MPDAGQFRTPWVEVLSGLGEKGPACIRVWTGQEHWLLDVGAGPEASSPFDPAWLEGADRVLVTHDHVDHIGGAGFAIIAGLLPIVRRCGVPTLAGAPLALASASVWKVTYSSTRGLSDLLAPPQWMVRPS